VAQRNDGLTWRVVTWRANGLDTADLLSCGTKDVTSPWWCLWQQARQQNTSTSSSSASSCCDESVQSSTTVASPSTSTNQKDRQRANTTPYSHSKLLQPTVVLRHWSGVSDRSASSKVKEAKFAEFSRRNDVQRVAVRHPCWYCYQTAHKINKPSFFFNLTWLWQSSSSTSRRVVVIIFISSWQAATNTDNESIGR